jgi:hypothetical protein
MRLGRIVSGDDERGSRVAEIGGVAASGGGWRLRRRHLDQALGEAPSVGLLTVRSAARANQG